MNSETISNLKRQLNDLSSSAGRGEYGDRRVAVSRRDLFDLIDDHEALDNERRATAEHLKAYPPEAQLATLLRYFWTKTGRNADEVLLLIFDILSPLISERIKTEKREIYYGESKRNAVSPGRLDHQEDRPKLLRPNGICRSKHIG
jgi:hypothetical protein